MILLKDHTQRNKLSPLWKGPYEILELLDSENVVISRNRKKVTVHKNFVKKYYENDDKNDEKND